ncbi:aldo/keto reductase [Streptomyces sp. 35G-GA-8]|uniref:aldo/keto reductase n=1 Tax=Streptomyces sp. 35G-GA-8 TaxID=2939434 RepID=UPI00201EFFCF|nr:aldo/keto reductase [Streptomyces sp. 35G-GA-8]MCL7377662.1 aldo/keto reductase [Streptomyces sp. 35G-GA-8]
MRIDDYRTVGRSGLRVSPLTLGAMLFEDPDRGCDRETSFEIMSRYVDVGGNTIDTANIYSGGRSEETVGAFLATRPELRDRLVISTKFTGNLFPGDPNGGGAGRKALMRQVEGSLRRLGTDYIDLYWLHGFDPHTPLEETVAALDEVVRSGKVRYVGFSDVPGWAIGRAATIAEFRGWSPIVALQPEYSLLARSAESEIFGVAHELRLGITPWSPLAAGVLSGRYTRADRTPAGAARAGAQATRARLSEHTFEVLDALGDIATRQGSTVAAVALAWVLQQPLVTSPIIGTRSVAHLDSALSALPVTFTPDELAALDQLTTPTLAFPYPYLAGMAQLQQAGTTINGRFTRVFDAAS